MNGLLLVPENAPYEEVYRSTSTQNYPAGTMLITQDGRKYRYGKVGATAAAAGKLYQSAVPDANFDELVVPTARAIGDREITVTTGATAVTADQLKGGYLNVEDDTGEGTAYLIEGNDAAATTATLTIRLVQGLKRAIDTNTTVGITVHPFASGAIVHPSPPTALLLGVPNHTIPIGYWGWFQRGGPCSILIDGTVVIAKSVMASDGTDGSVEAWNVTEGTPNTEIQPAIGHVIEVAATTEYGMVMLTIE